MTQKLKNIILLILVFIFMTPITIKLLDGLFHHHDHFHCTAKNENHFHQYHKKCPIPSFELSFFSVEKHVQSTHKNYFCAEQSENYHIVYCCNNSKYSFLLRAPPTFTDNIMTS